MEDPIDYEQCREEFVDNNIDEDDDKPWPQILGGREDVALHASRT